MRKIPLTILNGFLGAGKTTLLKHLLGQAKSQGLPLGVIVNDMSTLEVDGVLVNNNDCIGPATRNLVSIFGEDISSPTGLEKLAAALASLTQDSAPTHILLETSGSSHPLPLIKFLRGHPCIALKGTLAVADAVMLNDDHAGGSALLPRFQANLSAGTRDIHNLMVEQILFCSHLILSRADRLPAEQMEKIALALHPINPGIPIIASVMGNLSLNDVLALPDYDFHRVARLVDELQDEISQTQLGQTPYALDYRVIEDARPFHPRRLWETYHQFLGAGIHRSKGFFWLPSRDDLALLWNQASGSISLEIISFWKAGALGHADNRLSREERAMLLQQVQGMHPVFGDRRCELTVIGASAQLDTFTDALQQCFLTQKEIQHWQEGGAFDDPWPQRAIRLGN